MRWVRVGWASASDASTDVARRHRLHRSPPTSAGTVVSVVSISSIPVFQSARKPRSRPCRDRSLARSVSLNHISLYFHSSIRYRPNKPQKPSHSLSILLLHYYTSWTSSKVQWISIANVASVFLIVCVIGLASVILYPQYINKSRLSQPGE